MVKTTVLTFVNISEFKFYLKKYIIKVIIKKIIVWISKNLMSVESYFFVSWITLKNRKQKRNSRRKLNKHQREEV